MIEFLQSYGIWIFFGLLFLMMFRGRGRGMGCCGGGHQHDAETVEKDDQQGSENAVRVVTDK